MTIKEYNTEKIDKNDYLWMFVTIEKFLSIVLNNKLHFTRLDLFEDLQEGIFPHFLLFNKTKESLMQLPPFNEISSYHSLDLFPDETNQLNEEFKKIQKSHFANCWYLNKSNVESVAMWNLYSHPNSVALRIKYSDFETKFKNNDFERYDYFDSIILGKVKYFDFQNTEELDKIKDVKENSIFFKDISFNHENEFRIVIKSEYEEPFPKTYKEGISKEYQDNFYKSLETDGLDIQLHDFINYPFEIIFHPKMKDWVKDDLKMILSKFKIPFKVSNSVLRLQ